MSAVEVFEIEHAGKTWRVGRPDGTSRKAAIAAVARLAWANVAEMQEIAPEAYPEMRAEYFSQIGAGSHTPGGKLFGAAITGPSGSAMLLYSLLRPHHVDVTLADARELLAAKADDVGAAMRVTAPRFFEHLAADPNTPPEHRAAMLAAAEAMTPPPTPSSSPTATASV